MATFLKSYACPCYCTLRRYLSTTLNNYRETSFDQRNGKTARHRHTAKASPVGVDENENRESLAQPDRIVVTKPVIKKKQQIGGKSKRENIKQLKGGLNYEILEADDNRLGRTILQVKSKKDAAEKEEIIIEGANNIADALRANATMMAFYFSSTDVLEKFPLNLLPNDVPLYKAPKFKLNIFTDLALSPGILGLFKRPQEDTVLCPRQHVLPVTLVCNEIKDPSLLGSILQSAAAVGCERVILMKGCCDHWNSKVIRSSGLSQFYLPIISNIKWSQIQSFFTQNEQIFLLRKEKITSETIRHYDGSSDAITRLQEIEDEQAAYESDSDIAVHDEGAELSDINDVEGDTVKKSLSSDLEEDDFYYDLKHLKEYKQAPMTLQSYDIVQYTTGHSVVIIDEKYTLQSKKFVYDNNGQVIHFPIASQLYGLTAALAGNLVLFEADKQYRKLNETLVDETLD